jgi:DNA-binding MarR family transcriptional regulator
MTDSTHTRCHPPPEIQAIMAELYQVDDMRDMNLFRLLWGTIHMVDYLKGERRHESQLSAARMRVLIRLAVDNRLGRETGLQPSELSEFIGVSRNTVSALLNGLEEQGLIERHLHPTDRRQFLIRITPAGEDMVHERAPIFAAFVTDLLSALSEEERQTLSALLGKLFNNLAARAAAAGLRPPHPPTTEGDEIAEEA